PSQWPLQAQPSLNGESVVTTGIQSLVILSSLLPKRMIFACGPIPLRSGLASSQSIFRVLVLQDQLVSSAEKPAFRKCSSVVSASLIFRSFITQKLRQSTKE